MLASNKCHSSKIRWNTGSTEVLPKLGRMGGQKGVKKSPSLINSGLTSKMLKSSGGFGNYRDYSDFNWSKDPNSPQRNWTSITAFLDIVIAGTDGGEIWATQMGIFTWHHLSGTNSTLGAVRSISISPTESNFFVFVTDTAFYVASLLFDGFDFIRNVTNGHQCAFTFEDVVFVTGNATGQSFVFGYDNFDYQKVGLEEGAIDNTSLFPENNFPVFSSVYFATLFAGHNTSYAGAVLLQYDAGVHNGDDLGLGIPFEYYSSLLQYPIISNDFFDFLTNSSESYFSILSVANYSGAGQLLFIDNNSDNNFNSSDSLDIPYDFFTVISNHSYDYISFDHYATIIAATNYSNSILMNINPEKSASSFESVKVPCENCKFNQIGLSNYGVELANSTIAIGDFNDGSIWFYLKHNPFEYYSAPLLEILSYSHEAIDLSRITRVYLN